MKRQFAIIMTGVLIVTLCGCAAVAFSNGKPADTKANGGFDCYFKTAVKRYR